MLIGQGEHTRAGSLLEESLALFREVDETAGLASCLEGLAELVARQGEARCAARLWGAAASLHAGSGPRDIFLLPGDDTDDEHLRAAVRAELGEQTFAQALAEGRTMTPEQAVAHAEHTFLLRQARKPSGKEDRQALSSSAVKDLTAREVEVLRLLAQGLTDAQIAFVTATCSLLIYSDDRKGCYDLVSLRFSKISADPGTFSNFITDFSNLRRPFFCTFTLILF